MIFSDKKNITDLKFASQTFGNRNDMVDDVVWRGNHYADEMGQFVSQVDDKYRRTTIPAVTLHVVAKHLVYF